MTDLKSQKVEFKKPFVLLSENISLLQDILLSLEAAAQARRPLVSIAEDVDEVALPKHPLCCYGSIFFHGNLSPERPLWLLMALLLLDLHQREYPLCTM
jgi:hypothetical protein